MFKKVSKITLINIATQIISLAGFTVVARVIPPDALGQYMIYLSIISIVSVISTGFYEQAIYIEENKEKYKIIFTSIVYIAIVVGLVVFGVSTLYFGSFFISLLLFLGSLFASVKVFSVTYVISLGRLEMMSLVELFVSPILPLSLYVYSLNFNEVDAVQIFTINILVTSFISCSVFFLYLRLNSYMFIKYLFKLELTEIFKFMNCYKELPKFKMTSELFGVIALRLPVIVLGHFFSSSISAFYSISLRIAVSPISIITKVFSQMFVSEISKLTKNNHETKNIFIKFFKILFIIGIAAILSLYFISGSVINALFGSQYSDVYYYLISLAPYIFVLIVVSPLLSSFVIFRKSNVLFKVKFNFCVISIASYTLAVLIDNIYVGLVLFSSLTFLLYTYAFCVMFRIHKGS